LCHLHLPSFPTRRSSDLMAHTPMVALAAVLFAATSVVSAAERDLGYETLTPNDGWASFSGGTSGGAAADRTRIYTVQDRRGLLADRKSTRLNSSHQIISY